MTKDQVFELAKQAGFSVKNFKPPVVTAQHSNGSWVSVGDELERFAQLVRNSALEEAWQAAQPDDAYQDEWFKAKADACRRINLLKEKG